MIEGKIERSLEDDPHPHLALDGRILPTGHALDVRIAGQWIQGHIELGAFQDDAGNWYNAWYLETNVDSDPSVLLTPGVLARIDERW